MIDGAPQDQPHWHNLDKVDFVNGAHGPSHKHKNVLQMNDGAPKDQAQGRNLDILDFVSGAHGPAHKNSNFGK